jgi:hypothetical protein
MASEKDKDASSESAAHTEPKAKSEGKTQTMHNDKGSSRSQNKEHEKRSGEKRESENKSTSSKHGRDARLPAGKSGRTTDHETIQHWIEERGGSPAAVKATEKGEDPGLLRVNFPGYSGEDRLEDISWDDFFKKFDEKNLEFLYQDETRDGEMSRFWKFVSREGGHEKEKGKQ